MSMLVLRIIALAALVSPLAARAGALPLPQESSALRATTIEQISAPTTLAAMASIDQAGLLPAGALGSPVPASASADCNVRSIEVQGEGNSAGAVQTGVFDTAMIMQAGSGNLASVTQASNANFASVTQTGSNNVVTINQGR